MLQLIVCVVTCLQLGVVGVIAAVVVVHVVVEAHHEANAVVLEGSGRWVVVVVCHLLGRHSRQPCAVWSAVIQLHRHHPPGLLTVHITRWSLPALVSQLAACWRCND